MDGPLVAQAFSNLIANAVQHGRPDGVIHVAVTGGKEKILFEVENDAGPIPPVKLKSRDRLH